MEAIHNIIHNRTIFVLVQNAGIDMQMYEVIVFVLVQKAGIDMQMYEVIELLDHLEQNASNMGEADGVNYK